MNTTENNKLIQKFYDGTLHPMVEKGHIRGLNGLDYHTSWDWLMPVVEKIEGIESKYEYGTDYYDFHIMPDAIIVRKQSDEGNPLILINKSDGIGTIQDEIIMFETKLEATYKAVVEFIKWYNENKED